MAEKNNNETVAANAAANAADATAGMSTRSKVGLGALTLTALAGGGYGVVKSRAAKKAQAQFAALKEEMENAHMG